MSRIIVLKREIGSDVVRELISQHVLFFLKQKIYRCDQIDSINTRMNHLLRKLVHKLQKFECVETAKINTKHLQSFKIPF